MSSKALFLHVPVDVINIVNGPGPKRWNQAVTELAHRLQSDEQARIEVEFTLSTGASERTFKRTLTLSELQHYDADDPHCCVQATLNDRMLYGIYSPSRRSGMFDFFE